MKKIFLFGFMFFSLAVYSQYKSTIKIDDLQNEADVRNFVKSLDKFYQFYEVKSLQKFGDNFEKCKKIADSLNADNSFLKADFDNNGLTDVLVIGDDHQCYSPKTGNKDCDFSVLVILNKKNNFKIINLNQSNNCLVPRVLKDGDKNLIEVFDSKNVRKILKFKEIGFIEHNPNHILHQIKNIKIETLGCFGNCPVFEMNIDEKGFAELNAQQYNFSKYYQKDGEGEFTSHLNKKDLQKIYNMLNELDFVNLKDNYSVSGDDFPEIKIVVTYDDGKIKAIRDYGMRGTFGLETFYDLLFEIKKNLDWE